MGASPRPSVCNALLCVTGGELYGDEGWVLSPYNLWIKLCKALHVMLGLNDLF